MVVLLPTRHDRLSAAIDAVAAEATCRDELTWSRVEERAGVSFPAGDTVLRQQFRRLKLGLAPRSRSSALTTSRPALEPARFSAAILYGRT